MTDSLIYNKFIKNIKCNIIYHGSAIYNLAFKYYIEEALRKKITTESEIDDMKQFQFYRKYESVESYFTLIEKNHYNFTELTVIISSLHEALMIYLDQISILYTTIQNFYGKGKIKLNRDDPEDFIKQVTDSTSKYNPQTIRKQINTIQRYELVIKSIIKVIDTFIVPVLPEQYLSVFDKEKDIALKQMKDISNDYSNFVGQNIDTLKEQFKTQNKDLYEINIEMINHLSELNTYKECFVLVYTCNFSDIEISNVTKDLLENYKKYGSQLADYVSSKFPINAICAVAKALLSTGVLSKILPTYYTNVALNKYIKSISTDS